MRAAGCRLVCSDGYIVPQIVGGFTNPGLFVQAIRLMGLRNRLRRHFLDRPPDVFVGLDAPDFNLPLEETLRVAGIPTVHYVCPAVWAWRAYRVRRIRRAVDLVLALFPFEEKLLRRHGIPVRCVGFPEAENFADVPDAAAARASLSLPQGGTLIALLPGSRRKELEGLATPFLLAAQWCREREPNLTFASSMVSREWQDWLKALHERICPQLPLRVFYDRSLEVMQAADAILLASGTATLEAMILKRPMVVAYPVSRFNWFLASRVIWKNRFIALPNIIAGRDLVPEMVGGNLQPEALGRSLLDLLHDTGGQAQMLEDFRRVSRSLRRGGDRAAAAAVLDMIRARESSGRLAVQ